MTSFTYLILLFSIVTASDRNSIASDLEDFNEHTTFRSYQSWGQLFDDESESHIDIFNNVTKSRIVKDGAGTQNDCLAGERTNIRPYPKNKCYAKWFTWSGFKKQWSQIKPDLLFTFDWILHDNRQRDKKEIQFWYLISFLKQLARYVKDISEYKEFIEEYKNTKVFNSTLNLANEDLDKTNLSLSLTEPTTFIVTVVETKNSRRNRNNLTINTSENIDELQSVDLEEIENAIYNLTERIILIENKLYFRPKKASEYRKVFKKSKDTIIKTTEKTKTEIPKSVKTLSFKRFVKEIY